MSCPYLPWSMYPHTLRGFVLSKTAGTHVAVLCFCPWHTLADKVACGLLLFLVFGGAPTSARLLRFPSNPNFYYTSS